ncbi:hypothetical protein D3C75_970800 [compost metagenome]
MANGIHSCSAYLSTIPIVHDFRPFFTWRIKAFDDTLAIDNKGGYNDEPRIYRPCRTAVQESGRALGFHHRPGGYRAFAGVAEAIPGGARADVCAGLLEQ